MPNFEEDFYCQTCGYEHRNCKCNGDPRDARIAELEDCVVEQRLTIVKGDARIRELEAAIARVRDEIDTVRADMAHASDAAEREGCAESAEAYRIIVTRLTAALAPTPEVMR